MVSFETVKTVLERTIEVIMIATPFVFFVSIFKRRIIPLVERLLCIAAALFMSVLASFFADVFMAYYNVDVYSDLGRSITAVVCGFMALIGSEISETFINIAQKAKNKLPETIVEKIDEKIKDK